MTGDVIVTVKGFLIGNDGREDVELISPGKVYERNNKTYIRYEEIQPDGGDVTINTVKIGDEGVEIRKSGAITTTMNFTENSRNDSYYETPFGMMMLSIITSKAIYTMEDDTIDIKLNYQIEMDGSLLTDADLRIIAQKKEADIFTID